MKSVGIEHDDDPCCSAAVPPLALRYLYLLIRLFWYVIREHSHKLPGADLAGRPRCSVNAVIWPVAQ
jgi:hypothetical protein